MSKSTTSLAAAVMVLAGSTAILIMIVIHYAGVIRTEQNSISQLQNSTSHLQSRISNLDNQMSGLTMPSDPLASYNMVCSTSNVLNQGTGNYQTFWYPCTNQAQTTPQPGA